MGKIVRSVIGKGAKSGYWCDKCLATFELHKSLSVSYYDNLGKCIFCAAVEKNPTKKMTLEEIDIKKREIKRRLEK